MVFMKGVYLALLAVLGSAIPTKPVPAQSRGAVSSQAPTRISDAEVSEDGTVQIRFSNGRSIQVPPEKGQAGREQLQIAASGRSVGWLVTYNGLDASYSIPTTLTVYTVGKPLSHFSDGLMLLDWDFIDDDKHVQFSSSQTHGPGTDWLSMEVHDIETGRLLRRWLERSNTARTDVTLASISGLVTDGHGVALSDTVVSIRANPAAEPFALTTSNEGGHFTLQGIWRGQHELQFEHPRFKRRVIKITVGPSVEAIDAGAVTLERQPAPKE
jgi:hypothetical protein